jgi:uncharacterized repeat protein (TIGR03803 family)
MSVMPDFRCSTATSAFALAILATISSASAGTSEKILHQFGGGSDGSVPEAGLIMDGTGNLYGTTAGGGGGTGCFQGASYGCGTVFEISSGGSETVLHAFAGGCDGAFLYGGVLSDSQGNLYGTTEGGGTCSSDAGYGTIFKLAPGGAETVLYAFQGASDGSGPVGNLISDKNGNLFGTTEQGGDMTCGAFGCGVVFEITPTGKESVIHTFQGGADGFGPLAGVIMDSSGNLFGTTDAGGGSANCTGGCGTVFKIAPDGTETILHAFQSTPDGVLPESGLIADGAGNLYGTTAAGGSVGYGTVFEVTQSGSETILYSFKGRSDGDLPAAGLVMDKSHNLYGTTYGSGVHCGKGGCGVIFEVTAQGHEKVLYDFSGRHFGRSPSAGLLLGKHNDLYGTTTLGGVKNNGVVFELK